MSIFKNDQLRLIRRDIRNLREHEARLTENFNSLNESPERMGPLDLSLQAYLDNDLIVQKLISDIKKRIDYNRFNLFNIYSATWNRHFNKLMKEKQEVQIIE